MSDASAASSPARTGQIFQEPTTTLNTCVTVAPGCQTRLARGHGSRSARRVPLSFSRNRNPPRPEGRSALSAPASGGNEPARHIAMAIASTRGSARRRAAHGAGLTTRRRILDLLCPCSVSAACARPSPTICASLPDRRRSGHVAGQIRGAAPPPLRRPSSPHGGPPAIAAWRARVRPAARHDSGVVPAFTTGRTVPFGPRGAYATAHSRVPRIARGAGEGRSAHYPLVDPARAAAMRAQGPRPAPRPPDERALVDAKTRPDSTSCAACSARPPACRLSRLSPSGSPGKTRRWSANRLRSLHARPPGSLIEKPTPHLPPRRIDAANPCRARPTPAPAHDAARFRILRLLNPRKNVGRSFRASPSTPPRQRRAHRAGAVTGWQGRLRPEHYRRYRTCSRAGAPAHRHRPFPMVDRSCVADEPVSRSTCRSRLRCLNLLADCTRLCRLPVHLARHRRRPHIVPDVSWVSRSPSSMAKEPSSPARCPLHAGAAASTPGSRAREEAYRPEGRIAVAVDPPRGCVFSTRFPR